MTNSPLAGPHVLTVTPNPSLDLLFGTDSLVWDDANRMSDPRRRPGGQGINVSRAVRALGGASTAVALLGGRTGAEIAAMLDAEGTPLRRVDAEAETRTFVAVRESGSGRSLLLNARGPRRSTSEVEALQAAAVTALRELRPAWLACCGSLPDGFGPGFYAALALQARHHGAAVVVDCDGEPLRLAAATGCDLLVPNQHEAGRLVGWPVTEVADAARAARELCGDAAPMVAVTLGADGAVLAARTDGGAIAAWHADVPEARSGSAVGAGDAFLAALLTALPLPGEPAPPAVMERALCRAVAAGTATLLSSGAGLVDGQQAEELRDRVRLRRLE
jgi:1-phosphofructokinase family hexose kinase